MSRAGQRQTVSRPEIALKRAQNLIKVGKQQEALYTLYESLISRRQRITADQAETVIMEFLDLCIQNTKAKMAKEVLMQYRNQCQQQANVKSLEKVIKYYLENAEMKAEKAQKELDMKIAVVEDLEDEGSPEELMLSYVSKDNSENRTQREMVMPSFRFVWDSYRNMLDILRNNIKLEVVYALVIMKAMNFCKTYARKQEFRRLCETLRNHLQQLRKQTGQGQRDRSDLRQASTFNLYLDTRVQQLIVACYLESWEEAYRSTQDIQELLYVVPAKFRQVTWASQWAQYYAKLTLVFSASTAEISKLYLAYTWVQLYQTITQRIKGLPKSDYSIMANCVMLSILAVPPYTSIQHTTDYVDEQQQKQEDSRMEQLALVLGINIDLKLFSLKDVVNRKKLIEVARTMNIIGQASQTVQEIYMILEGPYNPLELCTKIQPLLDWLEQKQDPVEQNEDAEDNGQQHSVEVKLSEKNPIGKVRYGGYVAQLKKAAVLHVLKQLSGLYSMIAISRLMEVIPFYNFNELERIIVEAARFHYICIKIDHQEKVVYFDPAGFSSDECNNQLSTLTRNLDKLRPLVFNGLQKQKEAEIKEFAQIAKQRTEQEHQRTLTRKLAIEKRKEQSEKEILEKQRKQEEQLENHYKLQEEKRRQLMEQEEARRQKQREEREKQEEDMKVLERVIGKDNIEKVKGLAENKAIDRDQIIQEAQEEMLKSQEDQIKKLARTVRQVDHFERAKREKQQPAMKDLQEKYSKDDEQYFSKELDRQKEVHRVVWEQEVQEKKRVVRMQQDAKEFQDVVRHRRAELFAILRQQHEAKMAQVRAQKRKEFIWLRKQEYVKQSRDNINNKIAELEEEEKQRKEAEIRRQQEEQRVKLEEIARKQREKEEEIERRKLQEKEEFLKQDASGGQWQEVKRPTGAYVPKHRRGQAAGEGAAPAAASADRWERGGGQDQFRRPVDRGIEPGAPERRTTNPEESRDRWTSGGGGAAAAGARMPQSRGSSQDDRWQRDREMSRPSIAERPNYDRDMDAGGRDPRESDSGSRPWRPTRARESDDAGPPPAQSSGGYVPPSRRNTTTGGAPRSTTMQPPRRESEGQQRSGYIMPHMRDRGDERERNAPEERRPPNKGAGSASSRW